MDRLRPIHLALFALVGMYVVTTVFGAALFTTYFGREQLEAFMSPEPVPFHWMTTIGSPLYWSLLLSLVVIPPLAAIATERAAGHFLSTRSALDIPTWVPLALAAVLVAFCIYKLAMANGLTAREMWDRSVCYAEKIERRVELINLMGSRFYSFAYSSLPILASFLLAKGVLQKDKLALGAFLALSLILFWFYLAMIMKAPIIVYIGMIGLTLILCNVGWIRVLSITLPVAISVYLLLSMLQFCAANTWSIAENGKTEIKPGTVVSSAPAGPPPSATAGPKSGVSPPLFEENVPPVNQPASHDPTLFEKTLHIARNAVLRMAAAFPYYVQAFEQPDSRCGLEVPRSLTRSYAQACFPPTKVFRLMYPKITYVTGFAPAAVNVSAYAEIGPLYALVAMIGCGAIIGALGFLARGRNPMSVAIGATACIYAYYASQVSFTGSLVDSYGLFWLLFPIATISAISWISATLARHV